MSAARTHPRRTLVNDLLGNVRFGAPRSSRTVSSVEIRFGLDLAERDLAEALTSIAFEDPKSWVAFETRSTSDGLRHIIRAPDSTLERFKTQLRGLLPTARVESTPISDVTHATHAIRVLASHRHVLLRQAELRHTSTRLLAALTEPLRNDESLVLRVLLRPGKREFIPKDGVTPILRRNRFAKHHRSKLISKYEGACLSADVFVFARSATDARTRQLIRPVAQALRACQGEAGRIHLRRVSARRCDTLPPSWFWIRGGRITVTPAEAVGLLAWPLGSPQLEGLKLGVAPAMPAPKETSAGGRQFAVSNAGQSTGRSISQPIQGALQHTVIVGPTGSGKSTLIANLIRQDIDAGRGVLAVDAKGDLIDEILRHIPTARHRDVIVLDPASDLPQPGLQLFPPGGNVELSADHLVATLQELFKSSWGVRSSQYFRLGLVSLGGWRGATLLDLPRLFHDRAFRERVLTTVDDAYIIAAWQRYEALSKAEQTQHVASPMTKLQEIVGRRQLRAILGQRSPRLHFGEVLARGRIVLVRLSAGQLGAPSARLLAGLFLWQFFMAVEARSALAKSERTPFLAYIDEISAFAGLPLPIDGLLERARGLGVGLTLSPQALSQLDRDVQSAVLANAGTFLTFKPTSEYEARVAASALPAIDSDQLRHLDRFEVALRLSLGPGHMSTTMTGTSIDLPSEKLSDPTRIRRLAAINFGCAPDDPKDTAESEASDDNASNRRRRAK